MKEYHDRKHMRVFYSIPFIRELPYICNLNEYPEKTIIQKYVRKLRLEVIYPTSPKFGAYISENYEARIVYDCMDDMLAFSHDSYFIGKATKHKMTTVNREDLVLASRERIKHIPPVKHDDLLEVTKDVDAFIMPVEFSELIYSVYPVKLYEYINFGKNTLYQLPRNSEI